MIDVHAPHEAPHTWRDFFIHIATIVVGLCIAIGLEQTVEFFHHRHEVKETREALNQEREQNRKFYAVNAANFRLESAELRDNLRVLTFLQRHPGTPEEKLPGVLTWGLRHDAPAETVWKNAQQTQVLALMPRTEAEDDAALYDQLDRCEAAEQELFAVISRAYDFEILDLNPSHLNPRQLSEEIALTTEAMRLNFFWANAMNNLHRAAPDFKSGPTVEDMDRVLPERSPSDKERLAPARAIVDADLAPLRAAVKAANRAAGDN